MFLRIGLPLKIKVVFYNSFQELNDIIQSERDFENYIPSTQLCEKYGWDLIVNKYEELYN